MKDENSEECRDTGSKVTADGSLELSIQRMDKARLKMIAQKFAESYANIKGSN